MRIADFSAARRIVMTNEQTPDDYAGGFSLPDVSALRLRSLTLVPGSEATCRLMAERDGQDSAMPTIRLGSTSDFLTAVAERIRDGEAPDAALSAVVIAKLGSVGIV